MNPDARLQQLARDMVDSGDATDLADALEQLTAAYREPITKPLDRHYP